MANPKRKFSKARTRRHRAVWAHLTAPALGRCPHCHAWRPPHAMCPACGFYGGRVVRSVKKEPAAGE